MPGLAAATGLARRKLSQAVNLLADAGALAVSPTGHIASTNDISPTDAADAAARHQQGLTRVHCWRWNACTISPRSTTAGGRICSTTLAKTRAPAVAAITARAPTGPALSRRQTASLCAKNARHAPAVGTGVVREYAGETITIFFDDVGEKVLDLPTVLKQELLMRV